MSIEYLRNLIVSVPFRPFTLNIADGRQVPVIGRDFIFVPPEGPGRMLVVYQANGHYEHVNATMICGVSFSDNPAPSV